MTMKRKGKSIFYSALAYYLRADSIDVVVTDNDDGTRTCVAEALPSTAHPNVMGVVRGTDDEVGNYINTMTRIANLLGLKLSITTGGVS